MPTSRKATNECAGKGSPIPSKVTTTKVDSKSKATPDKRDRAQPVESQSKKVKTTETSIKKDSSPTAHARSSPPKESHSKKVKPTETSLKKDASPSAHARASPPKASKSEEPKDSNSKKVSVLSPKSTSVTPVAGAPTKFPPAPTRPAHLAPIKPKDKEGGQQFIHDIRHDSDMSMKTVSGRVNIVNPKVLIAKGTQQEINLLELVVSQVTSSIGIQIWLGTKKPGEVFAHMPEVGHIVQFSRVTAKRASYDLLRYNDALLSSNEKIVMFIVDDKETNDKCKFVHDPIFNDNSRSQSVSTTASQAIPIPDLNLGSFLEGFN